VKKKPRLELSTGGGGTSNEAAEVVRPERGVYVEEIAPPGEYWYKVVLSSGKVGIVHFPDELIDPDDPTGTSEQLWRMLDRGDPVQPRLRSV
jgi:hypothetical protein